MFVSIHIPKTAGTMLGYLFDFGSGRRLLWDYEDGYANAGEPDPMMVRNLDFVRSRFWGIHGHFFFRKYAGVLPDARFVTCLRHPVDRAVSQFRHEVYEALRGRAGWRTDAIRRGEMGLVEFVASDENVRCAQSVHLAGRQVEEYDFVFLQERIGECFLVFCRRFGFHRADPHGPGLPRINDGGERPFDDDRHRARYELLTTISAAERVAAFNLMPEEVDLYRRAAAHVGRLCSARAA
ncbi:MAG: sulfotransferase family 2 domain-containing protein [Alphaproteobacteria bacterium]